MHRIGFSYSDVKTMPRIDRTVFINLLKEEVEQERNAIERSKSGR